MKARHNKKRNTAFVYEALIREATAAILKKDTQRHNKIIPLIKKHFKEGSILRRELECHQALYENQGLDQQTSEKILKEAKQMMSFVDLGKVFKAQSALIKDINVDLGPAVFNTFVPNYKTLASISQVFSSKISPKEKVLLENEIINTMSASMPAQQASADIDGVVVRTFITKFNDKYDETLLHEQKELLTYYISSFADNALALKIFLNEEIARLKEELEKSLETPEIKEDVQMIEKTHRIIKKLQGYASESINDGLLLSILRTQSLVKEIHTNGNND